MKIHLNTEIQDQDASGAQWATEEEKREQAEREEAAEWERWFDFVRSGM